MILVFDVGNTQVTAGAFEGKKLLGLWRLASECTRTADEYGAAILQCLDRTRGTHSRKVKAIAIGSVVPTLTGTFERLSRRYFKIEPTVISALSPLGIPMRVDRPHEVGADRAINALAAIKLHGTPAIVLDFGTATTVDCISEDGAYLGGAILIGPQVAAQALAERTAQLPQVQIEKPERVLGKNTVECIQAGLFYGYLGMIDRIMEGSLEEMRLRKPGACRILVTGGLGGLFEKHLGRKVKFVPDLTLQGLRLAHEILNSKNHLKQNRK